MCWPSATAHLDDQQRRNIAGAHVAEMIGPESLASWLNGRRGLEAVVHMGAISATTETDVDLVMKTNVLLSLELWDWCACNRVPFIYASSAQVYGDGSSGFDDDQTAVAMADLSAITPYGASKLLFDRLVARERDAGRSTPPQWTGLRFFNVYGPREGHKGAMRSCDRQDPARSPWQEGRSGCSARGGRIMSMVARCAISSA